MLGVLFGDLLMVNDYVWFVICGQKEGLTLFGLVGGCVIDVGTH